MEKDKEREIKNIGVCKRAREQIKEIRDVRIEETE